MIPLPEELEAIEADLLQRRITGMEASQKVFGLRRRLGPPWQWKSWKSARVKVLGSYCETCGAGEEAILYVQHTKRNPRLKPYIEKAKIALKQDDSLDQWKAQLKDRMYAIRDAEVPELRDCCPKCQSLSIQYRKGAKTWICNSKSTGAYCAFVFERPAKKHALTAKQKKDIRIRKYQEYRNSALTERPDFYRDAVLAWITDFREYLSLKHTKTLCKRCAFLEDMVSKSEPEDDPPSDLGAG